MIKGTRLSIIMEGTRLTETIERTRAETSIEKNKKPFILTDQNKLNLMVVYPHLGYA